MKLKGFLKAFDKNVQTSELSVFQERELLTRFEMKIEILII